MRVLQIIDSFSFGGAERLLAAMNTIAPAHGLEMTVASLAPYSPERTASLDVLTAAGLRPSFIGARRLLDPSGIPRVCRAIRAARADVVHAHLGYSATLAPLAARIVGVPCVSTLHHLPSPDRSRRELLKERLWVRSADHGAALIFVSEAARRATEAIVGPARPTWRVLHNGVDLSRYVPRTGVERGPLPPDLEAQVPAGAPVVTIVAALREAKGHSFAIGIWDAVRSAVPDAVLLIAGTGEFEPQLRAMAGAGVVFAGSREDVPQILAGSTIAMLPTLTEALPTTMIEAAASGLPVVATTVGGTPETVEDGRTGLLVPPADPQALKAAVIALLTDPGRRAELGAAGRQLAEDRFDLGGWVQHLAGIYSDAVAGRAGRRREASAGGR